MDGGPDIKVGPNRGLICASSASALATPPIKTKRNDAPLPRHPVPQIVSQLNDNKATDPVGLEPGACVTKPR